MMTRGSEFAFVRRRRRKIAATTVRSLLSAVLLVVAYYQAPLDRALDAWLVVWLTVVGVALAAALAWQLRSIMKSDTPRLQAVETAAIGLPFLLLCYAMLYALLSFNEPASFTQQLGRTDALYFTMTVFSTIGFGDIAPVTEVARIVTMTQMVAGLVAVGIVAKLLVGAVNAANERISAEIAHEEADAQRRSASSG
jgi:voltage-gated potassium channel